MPRNELPIEIWQTVLSYLPRYMQRRLLFVSHAFRALVLPKLFQIVDIHFGWYFSTDWREDDEFEPERLAYRAYDILSHIVKEPRFASAVQHLRVQSYADGMSYFEHRHLCVALEYLQHLRSFSWMENRPPLTVDVARTLSNQCPNLEYLHLDDFQDGIAYTIARLNRLRVLRLLNSNRRLVIEPAIGGQRIEDEIDSLCSLLGPHIHELALPGSVAWKAPLLRATACLTHFEVADASTCPGLDLVLRHATGLESLMVIGALGLDFLNLLPRDDDTLQHLRSLKISLQSTSPLLARDGHNLAEFLRRHAQCLERFDFTLEVRPRGPDDHEFRDASRFDNQIMDTVLSALPHLKHLKALGYGFPPLNDIRLWSLLEDLTGRLPETLIGFRVSAFPVPDDFEPYRELLDRLSLLPSLKFISLSLEPTIYDGNTHIEQYQALDIVERMPHVDHIVLNDAVRGVDFDPEQDGGKRSAQPKWSAEKIRYRTSADFTTEEAYWLMAYYLPWEPAWSGLNHEIWDDW